MVFPIAGGTQDTGYEISNSLRFNRADHAILAYTPSSSSSDANKRKYTFSFWVKRGSISSEQGIINWGKQNGSDDFQLFFVDDNTLRFFDYGNDFSGSGYNFHKITSRLFRDPSAWYHIFLRVDTTDGTAGDRVQLYINGVKETSFGTSVDPSQNYAGFVGSADVCDIGTSENNSNKALDAYLSEFHYIDGTAKEYTDFGEFNDNGVWIPKKYTGSYGTNGFFLEFQQTGTSQNSSGIGADTSGNDNHFAVSNLAATDVTVDTPTNNFATLNPLQTITYPTVAEGNLVQTGHSSSDSAGIGATIMPASGKWYAEAKVPNISSASDGYPHFGITDISLLSTRGTQGTKIAAGFKINDAASVTNTNILGTTTLTNTNWPSWSDDDIINFALDLDNRKLYIGKNGTYINSGNPAAGSNHQITWANSTEISLILAGYSVSSGSGGGGDDTSWNYGNPAFSISSGNADANGYGNFEYAPPSGYYALCTKNLAEYG